MTNLAVGQWRRRHSGPRRQVLLPAADVDPAAALEADSALDPRQGEAQLLVQRHARGVGEGNPGDDGDEALPLEHVEMRAEQPPAEAAALRVGREIKA